MSREIDWHTTTNVWLHLEQFTNAGLTYDQMKEAIENYGRDLGCILSTERMGINDNMIVDTQLSGKDIGYLVQNITMIFNDLVKNKVQPTERELNGRVPVNVRYAYFDCVDEPLWIFNTESDSMGLDPWTQLTGIDRSTGDTNTYFIEYGRTGEKEVAGDYIVYMQKRK